LYPSIVGGPEDEDFLIMSEIPLRHCREVKYSNYI
jgi:hypothetical protein